MPDNDHQARSTRFSKSGTTVFVRLRVDRRGYEYARHWARFQHAAMPNGTAEDQLEGYLNQALADAMDSDKWQCPLEIAALYPPPRPMPASDPDDDIPRWAESIGIESDARYVRMAEKAIPKLSSLAAVNPVRA